MSLQELPPELLLKIANDVRDDRGELRYGDFNSFVQVIIIIPHVGMQPFS
jgi:hypothetical protein